MDANSSRTWHLGRDDSGILIIPITALPDLEE
jgi:hypothetical protein